MKFKDASITYVSRELVNTKDLKHLLKKLIKIQWDYKKIINREVLLVRIKKIR